jgi:hypothetical protein
MKRLDERDAENEAMYDTIQALDLHMTCKVCGNARHSGNDCPDTREEAFYMNNGFRPQGGQGWNNHNQLRPQYQGGNSNYTPNLSNQPSLKDLVLGQGKMKM